MYTYHTFLLSFANARSYFYLSVDDLTEGLYVPVDAREDLYDWLVHWAVQEVVSAQGTRVDNVYRHDVYRCVYDRVGPAFEAIVRCHFNAHRIHFEKTDRVKLLVAGDLVTLAKGICL